MVFDIWQSLVRIPYSEKEPTDSRLADALSDTHLATENWADGTFSVTERPKLHILGHRIPETAHSLSQNARNGTFSVTERPERHILCLWAPSGAFPVKKILAGQKLLSTCPGHQ